MDDFFTFQLIFVVVNWFDLDGNWEMERRAIAVTREDMRFHVLFDVRVF